MLYYSYFDYFYKEKPMVHSTFGYNIRYIFLYISLMMVQGCGSSGARSGAEVDITPPVFSSPSSVAVNENQTLAITLVATDTNTITYSISGVDSDRFDIVETTGEVTFKTPPDYESGKTSYLFTATATDTAGNSSTLDITISIIDIDESGPEINNISGIFKNGETLTLSGNNFSTKPRAEPLISSYDHPSSNNNWSSTTLDGNWTASGHPHLTNAQRRVPFYQGQYNITYNNSYSVDGYDSIRFLHMVPEDKLYVSFWMYRDTDSLNELTGSGNNSKIIRVHQSASAGTYGDTYFKINCDDNGDPYSFGSSGDQLAYADNWYIGYSSPECNAYKYNNRLFNVSAKDCLLDLKHWEHYEYYLDYPSTEGGTDGMNIVFKDGTTLARSMQIATNESGATDDRRWVLIGQVSGGSTTSYNAYIDQVYIDNTPAHIYLSDSANASWPDIDHFHHNEIQVVSSWTDHSISFTFNQGGFSSGDTVYVYVVDTHGNCNSQGYPMSID